MLGIVLRVLAAAAVLFVIQGLAFGLTSALLGPSLVELPPGALPGVVLSNLVTAGALFWLARRSRLSGARLAACLAVVLFGVSNFIYGAAVAWLMTPPPRPVEALAGSSA